jgi:hypothetical protein
MYLPPYVHTNYALTRVIQEILQAPRLFFLRWLMSAYHQSRVRECPKIVKHNGTTWVGEGMAPDMYRDAGQTQ